MLARRHIPNLLTLVRLVAVPVSVAIIYFAPECAMALFWIFVVASLTDFLDGYLARKWKVVSPLGTLLDPIADKLLVATLLLYLLHRMGAPLLIAVIIIILRELYVSGLREFLALKKITLPVSRGGKLKTATQMAAIICLLGRLAYNPPHQLHFPCAFIRDNMGVMRASCVNQPWLLHIAETAGLPLLYIAAAIAFLTAADYTIKSWKHLR